MSMQLMRGDILGTSVGTSELEDNSVTYAKLNADIVGIDTTTGKINDINTTNFKSLNGTNLTNVGSLVAVETITLGSTANTIDSSTLDLSAFKNILVCWEVTKTAASGNLTLRFNDDSGANYDNHYVEFGGDVHAASNSDNATVLQLIDTNLNAGFFIIQNAISGIKIMNGMGGMVAGTGRAFSSEWDITPEAITKISLLLTTMAAGSRMSIYGMV